MDVAVRAGGLILRRPGADGDRWLLLRSSRTGEWGFPKGKAEPGESWLAAARRECAEECGIALVAIEGPPLALAYRLSSGRRKEVRYFPARTAQQRVVLSREHDLWAWLTAAEVLKRLPHLNIRNLFRTCLARRPYR